MEALANARERSISAERPNQATPWSTGVSAEAVIALKIAGLRRRWYANGRLLVDVVSAG
jgi:hypothetical protein